MREVRVRFWLLDILRGVAAVWVLTFHYQFSHASVALLGFIHSFFTYGTLGVPMFFVISGFCLAASARNAHTREETPARFLQRRFTRIYPPLWCSILVVALIPFVIESLSWLKTGSFTFPSAANPNCAYIAYDALDWMRVATLTQAFVTTAPTIGQKFGGINAVYWSLAIEVQFYLVVAAALACGKRMYTILLTVTAVSIPFALQAEWYEHGIFLPWWPMFAFGVLLYFLLEREWGPGQLFGKYASVVCWMAVGIAVAVFMVTVAIKWSWSRPAFAGGFAITLWFAAGIDQQVEACAKPKDARVAVLTAGLVLLGSMSYSVYLIHGRLQYLVMQLVRQVVEADTIGYDLLVIAGVLVLCYPFYRFCEVPFFRPKVANDLATEPAVKSAMQAAG